MSILDSTFKCSMCWSEWGAAGGVLRFPITQTYHCADFSVARRFCRPRCQAIYQNGLGVVQGAISNLSPVSITRVVDGDTAVTSTGARIRLMGIDTPEVAQPYGPEATNALRRLLFGRTSERTNRSRKPHQITLRLRDYGPDRYGRTLGTLFRASNDSDDPAWWNINDAMVAQGWAWAYDRSTEKRIEKSPLLRLEESARLQRLGLWMVIPGAPPPELPQAFRRHRREQGRKARGERKRGKKSM